MPASTAPDPLVVLVAALNADAGVSALTDRIGTRTPTSLERPFVRATLLDDRTDASSPVVYNVDALVQLDCYGGDDESSAQGEASELARAVRAALYALPGSTVEGAIVTAALRVGIARIPDSTLDPPRERYIVTGSLYYHGAPA